MPKSNFRAMWTPAYTVLFLFEFFAQMGAQVSIPIVSNYALALGATVALAGFIASLNSVCALALRLFCGPFFDRFPIKKLFVAFSIIFCITCLTCGFVQDIIILAICRIIFGAALVGKTTLIIVLAARILPESTRGEGVAWLALSNVFAIAICPMICSYIGPRFGWNLLFYLSAFFFALAMLCSFMIIVSPVQSHDSGDYCKSGDEDGALQANNVATNEPTLGGTQAKSSGVSRFIFLGSLPIALVGLLEAFGYGTITTLTLTVGELRGIEEISLYFIAYVVVSFAARPVSGKLYDAYGFGKLGIFFALCIIASMIVFAYAQTVPMIMLSGALFAIGQGCLWPCLQAESVKGVPESQHSLAANTMLFGVDAGCSLGPIVSGMILDATSTQAMFWFCAFVGLCMLFAIIWYIKRGK